MVEFGSVTPDQLKMVLTQGVGAAGVYLTAKGLDPATKASILGTLVTIGSTVVGNSGVEMIGFSEQKHVKMAILTGILDALLKKLMVEPGRNLYNQIVESISIAAGAHVLTGEARSFVK